MNVKIYFIIMTAIFHLAFAQDTTNFQRLSELAEKFHIRHQIQKQAALQMAQENGWPVKETMGNGKAMEIMGVTEAGQPIYYITDNLNAAKTVSTDKVWPGGSSGLSLDGTGMTAGEWDENGVRATHQELSGRITQKDSPSGYSDHSTHVAGTILASGVRANAHGMAPSAQLDAYEWNDDESEMSTAAAAGLLISNHSYGIGVGWHLIWWYGDETISEVEDYKFGFYDTGHSQAWDDIAYNAPYYLIMKSAGNDRGEGQTGSVHELDGGDNGYDCIGPQGVAKNIMTIGAVNDISSGYSQPSDVVMSSFSSWGPTDDGRIKPDVVANGVGLYSCVASGDANYATYDGTSMATPSATGSLLLLQEIYHNRSGGFYMRAATLKGLAIHTADEAGSGDGPDYKFGWGLLNTAKAAALIDSVWIDQKEHTIKEVTLNQGDTYTIQITSDGSQPLWATICWTDPAGTPVANQLDPSDIMLVNDLDLRISNGVTTYYPWKFASPDPNNPSNVATTGDNIRDNVEQVYISAPSAGTHTITVNHKGTLQSGSQVFSLIMSGGNYSDASLPVELVNFKAQVINNLVQLSWQTKSELENLGFEIYKKENTEDAFTLISTYRDNPKIRGKGNSSASSDYNYLDMDVETGKTYSYKLADVDYAGRRTFHQPLTVKVNSFIHNLNRKAKIADHYELFSAFPNPFGEATPTTRGNPSTNIPFQIVDDVPVRIQIFNAKGQKVATLVNSVLSKGYYEYKWDAAHLSSGIYFIHFQAGHFIKSKKVMLLR